MLGGLKLIALALILIVAVAGCVGQTASSIKSQEEAGQAIEGVGSGVEKIGTGLEDVESGLKK